MTTTRRHICDVAGCTRERKRWQRICVICFGRLHGHKDLRAGILDAHRLGDRRRKRALSIRAGEALGYTGPAAAAPPRPAPPPRWWDRD